MYTSFMQLSEIVCMMYTFYVYHFFIQFPVKTRFIQTASSYTFIVYQLKCILNIYVSEIERIQFLYICC